MAPGSESTPYPSNFSDTTNGSGSNWNSFRKSGHRIFDPRAIDLNIQISVTLLSLIKLVQSSAGMNAGKLVWDKVYTNRDTLIKDSKGPKNVSLAAFKPKRLIGFIVEDDDREWKEQWLEQLKQVDIFTSRPHADNGPRVPIDKIPYKFEDEAGRVSTMTIEDWEIGALYRNCLAAAEGDESIAVEKVREKYEKDFMQNKDIVLFLGTTLEHHRARHTNPFTIIGVFYPPQEQQHQLF